MKPIELRRLPSKLGSGRLHGKASPEHVSTVCPDARRASMRP